LSFNSPRRGRWPAPRRALKRAATAQRAGSTSWDGRGGPPMELGARLAVIPVTLILPVSSMCPAAASRCRCPARPRTPPCPGRRIAGTYRATASKRGLRGLLEPGHRAVLLLRLGPSLPP
jgi:hypothetical protein